MNKDGSFLRIGLAQLNFHVGHIKSNTAKILREIENAQHAGLDIIVFPELSITGYPPEDLLNRKGLYLQVNKALKRICEATCNVTVILGFPRLANEVCFNSAAVIRQKQIIGVYDKWALPNYGVFDEKRYFEHGEKSLVFLQSGINIGVTICEDVWVKEPLSASVQQGAELIININASPFNRGKMVEREEIVRKRVMENLVPVVYVNTVGGQDELVFDGASFVMNRDGSIALRFPAFEECVSVVEFDLLEKQASTAALLPHPGITEAVYQALVLGVRDYVKKNGFHGVILGLSGGIDSALTLMIAVDALGVNNVETVMLPTRYTADMSLEDAQLLAQRLGVEYKVLPIESVFESLLTLLEDEFRDMPVDVTEENIQARIRGIILMAISNKKGKMVLTTGNKSEMAVGYSTLYGDMAGGFDVLKDVPKTLVFDLARYCNREREIIPVRIIERPPSAELREDQTDQDSLPPYEILDKILDLYVEQEKSIDAIVALGFQSDVVKKVARLVDLNEYKRRQAPPGVRITPKAFGKDRRYPLTSGFWDQENE